MRMKLDQSYLSSNETLDIQNSSGKEENIEYGNTYDSESDHLILDDDGSNQENLDCNITNHRAKNCAALSDNMNAEEDYEKSLKRKASSSETISSAERSFKRMKKTLTPESSPRALFTPATPSPPINNIDFIRRLKPCSTVVGKDYFASLPDEILLMIFKNCSKPTLVNSACVCRRWKDVALDNDLWIRIDVSQRKILPGIMAHILSRKPVVLRMAQTEVLTPIFADSWACKSMAYFNNKIEYLDLSMAIIRPHDLELLLRTCQSLVKLSLESCEINENVCEEIAKNVKLTVLNLSQCVGLDDAGVRSLLRNCSNLVELNIAWTSLNANAIKSVCQFVPENISKLNFSGCAKEMTDAHVSALVLRCNKLKELDLSDATAITGSSVEVIRVNLKNLQILSLSRCYNIYPTNYTKLFALPSLTHLNIFGLFSESQIEQLRKAYRIGINLLKFSHIARPTVGDRRSSIWCVATKD